MRQFDNEDVGLEAMINGSYRNYIVTLRVVFDGAVNDTACPLTIKLPSSAANDVFLVAPLGKLLAEAKFFQYK